MRSWARHIVSCSVEQIELRILLTQIVPFQEQQGSIGIPGEVDEFTIELGAHQSILLAFPTGTQGNFSPRFEIYSPTGSRFGSTSGNPVASRRTTALAGTYVIRVHDENDDSVGSYAFTIFAATGVSDGSDDTLPRAPNNAIPINHSLAAGDADVIRVGSAPFGAIVLNAVEKIPDSAMSLGVWLVRNDGTVVASAASETVVRQTYVVPENTSFTYYAVIRNSESAASGDYTFTFHTTYGTASIDSPEDSELMWLPTNSRSLPTQLAIGDIDGINFPVAGNTRVTVDITADEGSELNPLLMLFDPGTGELLATANGDKHATLSYLATEDRYFSLMIMDREGDSAGSAQVWTAATDPYAIVGGVLHIVGTAGPDRVIVSQSSTSIHIDNNGDAATLPNIGLVQIICETGSGDDEINFIDVSSPTIIDAGSGADSVMGGSGPDRIRGGSGRNTLDGGDGDDYLLGASGRDILRGGDGNDRLMGWSGNDWLIGGPNVDHIYGNTGDDRLDGGSSNDYLFGGPGNDTLNGGAGLDLMYGEEGNDLFYAFDSAIDRVIGGDGTDTAQLNSDDERYSIEILR